MTWEAAHDPEYCADRPGDGEEGPPVYRMRDDADPADFDIGGGVQGRPAEEGVGWENYPWAYRLIRESP